MAKDAKLVPYVQDYFQRVAARIEKVAFPQHTATISWTGGSYTFQFQESIKHPAYMEQFKLFLDYPDLKENGLRNHDFNEFTKYVADLETMSDDEILNDACFHEEDLWKPVGEYLAGITFNVLPETVSIQLEDGRLTVLRVEADDYGKYTFRITANTIYTVHSFYTKKCLRKVESEVEDEDGTIRKVNIHRFFDLIPNNMLDISLDVGARFGRIGEQGMNLIDDGDFWRKPKPSQLFWLYYYQKLNDGYMDLTSDLMETEDAVAKMFREEDAETEVAEDDAAVEFYQMVIEGAKSALDEFGNDWLSNPNPYNGRTLNSCWKVYTALSEAINVDVTGLCEPDGAHAICAVANDAIKRMIAVINPPFKKGYKVESFLIPLDGIKTIDDAKAAVNSALTLWEARIQAMEALTSTTTKQSGASKKLSPFGEVKVTRPTEEQMEWIKGLVAATQPKYVDLIRKAYMLDPVSRRKTYEEALEKAEDKTEKDLFHGTLTGNVASITSSGGPTIHVAAANGRAFGNGSYWSSDPDKSAGYSSYGRYSRWAGGSDACGWLFIGRIHYGKAYDPYGSYNGQATEAAVKSGGYDCCHARPGRTSLLRDEIITYDEAHSYVQAVIMIGDAPD